MKIFEVTENLPQSIVKPDWQGPKRQHNVTTVPVTNTDAANLTWNGYSISGKLYVLGLHTSGQSMKSAKAFYFKDTDNTLNRVDDKQLSKKVVNILDIANKSPGRLDRVKNKISNIGNPTDPDSNAYDITARDSNFGITTQDGPVATALTRGASALDKNVARPVAKATWRGTKKVGNAVLDKFNKLRGQ